MQLSCTDDPYLDYGLAGWIEKTALANLRHIKGYDLDDLIQEGWACYCKCRNYYVGTLNRNRARTCRYIPVHTPTKLNRRHFMALVKTAVSNRFATLARESRKVSSISLDEVVADALPAVEEVATLTTLLLQMPAELRDLVGRLVGDTAEFLDVRGRYISMRDRPDYQISPQERQQLENFFESSRG